MASKVFNLRTGLVVMFALLVGSYAILFVIIVNNVYEASQTNTTSDIDVIERSKFSDGSEIEVPKTVTVGEPFVYHVKGKKLIENGADVRLQINCIVDGNDTPYTLGTFYSDLPKGNFDLNRTTTIAVSSRLQASDNCRLTSVATYTFYVVDKNGEEQTKTVREVAESGTFKLVVPTTPATQPNN